MSRYALICRIVLVVVLAAVAIVAEAKPEAQPPEWLRWHRPVDNPVFTVDHGNNHDSILFVEPDLEYPYHLIISHEREHADLWRAKKFSWSSDDWELVDDEYKIGGHYEYDDGGTIQSRQQR